MEGEYWTEWRLLYFKYLTLIQIISELFLEKSRVHKVRYYKYAYITEDLKKYSQVERKK